MESYRFTYLNFNKNNMTQESKFYVGQKAIKAWPMNREKYNEYRGWKLPEDENGEDEGYLVEYLDGGQSNHELHEGYVSWSPKNVFEEAYREADGLPFGVAVEAMKRGKKVTRTGWNGKGMYAYYVPEAKYPAQRGANMEGVFENDMVPYRAYLALKTAQNDIATWSPSTSDVLAEDWIIL